MMGIKDLATGRKDIFKIPVDLIIFEEGQNPRDDFSHVEQLAQSIIQYGQLEPIKVILSDKGDFVYGVHGESRYRAILLANKEYGAKIETIDCVSAPKDYDKTDIIMEHFERGSTNKPLNALELAKVYKYLKDEVLLTVGQIADRCRKSDQHVYDHLKLLEAPLTVIERLKSGEISASAAIEIAKKTPAQQEKIVERLDRLPESGGESSGPRERITKADVETATDGHPRQISAKEIRGYIKTCDLRIGASRRGSKELEKWEGVKYGLETSLGLHDDDWKQKDEI